MPIKILTHKSTENTNIDGARANHFNAGMKSGIVKGALNEGKFFASSSNVIALESCELRISGHQIIIDTAQYITLQNAPSVATRYSLIAEIQVDTNGNPSFRLFIQPANTILIEENLFKSENGSGTYQLRIGNFTLDTNGLIHEVNRMADIISGGGLDCVADIVFNASVEMVSGNSEPEANVDYNEETKEFDMRIKLPSTSGSQVLVYGMAQESISFRSDPQTQIDNLLFEINGISEALEDLNSGSGV